MRSVHFSHPLLMTAARAPLRAKELCGTLARDHTAFVTSSILPLPMLALLKVLTNAIIPPDARDGGAESVGAADQIVQRIEQGINRGLYLNGLSLAARIVGETCNLPPESLTPDQAHQLVGTLRAHAPAFYKQLRMDVSAIYLSDPAVWARIGFPGPSIEKGGYPDFDQPQH
jgi:hypothetical protein